MYCPACGAPNTEDARFCNQCGARIASMAPVGSTQAPAAAPAPRVPSRQGASGDAPPPPPRGATTTSERVELPMVGPSRRTMAVGGVVIAAAGIALGAFIAFKSVRAPTPPPTPAVTPVDLLGVPSAVPNNPPVESPSNEPSNPSRTPGETQARAPRPPRTGNGATTPTTPTTPGTTRPPRTSPGGTTTAGSEPGGSGTAGGGTTGGGAEPGGSTPDADAGRGGTTVATRDPQNPGGAGGTNVPAPPENGVIERGPRTSRGGYTLGEETDATGTMDPQVFGFVYRRYAPQIAACHSSVSRQNPVGGVLVMRVRIGENGRVARTRVISDTTGEPRLAACVQESMRNWRYPQPEGGEVEVDYPLRFQGR